MAPFDSLFDISVIKDDVRTLSAEFESDFFQASCARNFFADCCRACECNFIDSGVTDDSSAGGLAEAGDNVDCASGEASFLNEGTEIQCTQRSLFCSFEDDSVAACKCGCDLPGYNQRGRTRDIQNIDKGKFQGIICPQTPMGS